MRLTAKVSRRPQGMMSEGASIPAPVGGWDAVSPLANMPPERAVAIDNFICRPGWIEVRRGYQFHAAAAPGHPVETVMAYNGFGGINKLFAVAGGTIYDVTATNGGVATTVTGLASSRCQHLMFSNSSGNQYLIEVNGTDVPKIYNGTTWADLSVTGSGITPSNFVQIAEHKGRLWFVETGSTTPCYLPVDAIAGTAASFPLGPFMGRGGYVVAIGTWTVDTRQTVDEYVAFITSRGQVIVYEGTDPSSADTWTLVGVYNIGPPIGRRCLFRMAGNLLIITIDGVVGMSEMLSTDRGAANRIALTSTIMNAMNKAAQSYKDNFGWQIIEYPRSTLAILNIPVEENQEQMQFVMNTLTGAWSRFLGIDANCWEVDANDDIYFGHNNGHVYKWDVGSSDYIAVITATVKTAFNYFGTPGIKKRWPMLQPVVTSNGAASPAVGINVDFRDDAVLTQPSVFVGAQPLWDQVDWDEFNWPPSDLQIPNWISITALGQCASVVTQIVTGQENFALFGLWGSAKWGEELWETISTGEVTLQLNSWNIVHERGAFV
jgi:hypothetical protein